LIYWGIKTKIIQLIQKIEYLLYYNMNIKENLDYLLNFIGVDDETDIIINNNYTKDDSFSNKMGENYYKIFVNIPKGEYMFLKNKGCIEIQVKDNKKMYFYNQEAIDLLRDKKLI